MADKQKRRDGTPSETRFVKKEKYKPEPPESIDEFDERWAREGKQADRAAEMGPPEESWWSKLSKAFDDAPGGPMNTEASKNARKELTGPPEESLAEKASKLFEGGPSGPMNTEASRNARKEVVGPPEKSYIERLKDTVSNFVNGDPDAPHIDTSADVDGSFEGGWAEKVAGEKQRDLDEATRQNEMSLSRLNPDAPEQETAAKSVAAAPVRAPSAGGGSARGGAKRPDGKRVVGDRGPNPFAEDQGDGEMSFASLRTGYPEKPTDRSRDVMEDSLRKKFEEDRDRLESREMGHNLAEALTRLGSSLSGLKTGTDMTHLKMKDHDFQKDQALLQDQLKNDMAEARARREEDLKTRQLDDEKAYREKNLALEGKKAASQRDIDLQRLDQQDVANSIAAYRLGLDEQQLAIDANYKASMAEYHKSLVDMNKDNKSESAKAKVVANFSKAKQDAMEVISRNVLNNKEMMTKRPDAAISSIVGQMSILGADPKEVRDAVADGGWTNGTFGYDVRPDAGERLGLIMQKLQPPLDSVKLEGPGGYIQILPAIDPRVESLKGKQWKQIP